MWYIIWETVKPYKVSPSKKGMVFLCLSLLGYWYQREDSRGQLVAESQWEMGKHYFSDVFPPL